jgi:hypothetical protein
MEGVRRRARVKLALAIGGALLAIPFAGITVYGIVRTQRVEADPRQKAFAAAARPDPGISGLYRGSLQGREVTWKGKKFKADDRTGINLFLTKEGKTEERYPFRTRLGRGVKDKMLEVLKIDYDLAGNPWWLRRVLDEVVEVAPGELLGKVHLRWVLGMTFTMGYFKLERVEPISAPPAPDGPAAPLPAAG